MINNNIINNLIKGITEQIPLVHSYYNVTPYDSWNSNEVKYGSVSFVITNVRTRETTSTYTGLLYYADRLTESGSNVDAVHSDAAAVIQTIVGAMNQADEMLNVTYPVTITFFEQDFADRLAGGYATVEIQTEGMGECFEDELTVPQIVATSAYFTKDEIAELFPVKTDFAKVAFTGSYNDLVDASNLTTKSEYNNLVESVIQSTSNLAAEVSTKVSAVYFDNWADNIEKQLENSTTKEQFDKFVDITNEINKVQNAVIENKVDYDKFNDEISTINDRLNASVNEQQYNQLLDAQNALLVRLESCVDKQQYNYIVNELNLINDALNSKIGDEQFAVINAVIEQINAVLDTKVGLQEYNSILNQLQRLIAAISN